MLDIRLELSKINYRKCIEVLLPPLVEHCASKSAPNELDKFLAKLGPDAARAACAVLDGMSADDRDKMVVWLVSAHEERMRNSANRHLSELFGAPLVRIGHFAALDRPGSRLSLLATQINADYASLLQSPLVKEGVAQLGQENAILKGAAQLALQLGAYLPPESLEKYGLGLLNSEGVKQRLKGALQEGVLQAGLDAEIEDMFVEQSGAGPLPDAAGEGAVPDSFEEELLGALSAQAEALRRS